MNADEARDLKKLYDDLGERAVAINRRFQENGPLLDKIIAECRQDPSGYTALAVELGKSDALALVGQALNAYMKKHNVQ